MAFARRARMHFQVQLKMHGWEISAQSPAVATCAPLWVMRHVGCWFILVKNYFSQYFCLLGHRTPCWQCRISMSVALGNIEAPCQRMFVFTDVLQTHQIWSDSWGRRLELFSSCHDKQKLSRLPVEPVGDGVCRVGQSRESVSKATWPVLWTGEAVVTFERAGDEDYGLQGFELLLICYWVNLKRWTLLCWPWLFDTLTYRLTEINIPFMHFVSVCLTLTLYLFILLVQYFLETFCILEMKSDEFHIALLVKVYEEPLYTGFHQISILAQT